MENSVTLKYGTGYDESWATFKGTLAEIRESITGYFGYESAEVEKLTLHDLVLLATDKAHGTNTVRRDLGGQVVSSGGDPGYESSWSNPASHPADRAEPKQEENPNAWLLALIQQCESVTALQTLWAKNQDVFNEDGKEGPLMVAWKARGKALSAS